ncbi:MAG: hypothetical protein ACOYM9_10715, partial [Bradymonadia bacterium]
MLRVWIGRAIGALVEPREEAARAGLHGHGRIRPREERAATLDCGQIEHGRHPKSGVGDLVVVGVDRVRTAGASDTRAEKARRPVVQAQRHVEPCGERGQARLGVGVELGGEPDAPPVVLGIGAPLDTLDDPRRQLGGVFGRQETVDAQAQRAGG